MIHDFLMQILIYGMNIRDGTRITGNVVLCSFEQNFTTH